MTKVATVSLSQVQTVRFQRNTNAGLSQSLLATKTQNRLNMHHLVDEHLVAASGLFSAGKNDRTPHPKPHHTTPHQRTNCDNTLSPNKRKQTLTPAFVAETNATRSPRPTFACLHPMPMPMPNEMPTQMPCQCQCPHQDPCYSISHGHAIHFPIVPASTCT